MAGAPPAGATVAATVVTGTVHDVDGHPVGGASVLAARGDGDPAFADDATVRARTRDDGHFTFVGLPPAPYSFVVLPEGLPAGASPLLPLHTTLEVEIVLDTEPPPA